MTKEQALAKIETWVGRLPDDYRAWLLEDEPADPCPAQVTIPDRSPWTDELVQLYSVEALLDELTTEQQYIAAEARNYPRQTIPIGDNGESNFFLLSLRPDDFGSVYYLFHETACPMEDDSAGIFVLASGFSKWLGGLERIEGRERGDTAPKPYDEKAAFEAWLRTKEPPRKWWQFWRPKPR